MIDTKKAPFWMSWSDPALGDWELHSPWWISGYDSQDLPTICAAVMAHSEDEAMDIARNAYDDREVGRGIEFRFCVQKEAGWSPFCGRFGRSAWMKWDEEALR